MIYDIYIPAGSTPFGVWLVTTAAKRDFTVSDIATQLKVKPPTVRQWCVNPERLTMKRLIQIINVLVDDKTLWRPYMDHAFRLITQSHDPNNKQINQYKNREIPE